MKTRMNFVVLLLALLAVALYANAQTELKTSQLPKGAHDFVKKYFSENAIVYAERDRDIFDKEYEVKLSDGTEIEFDYNGKWKKIEAKRNTVPVALLPAPIAAHILRQHATQNIVQAEKKSWGYEVELRNGAELEFNRKGQYLRTDY